MSLVAILPPLPHSDASSNRDKGRNRLASKLDQHFMRFSETIQIFFLIFILFLILFKKYYMDTFHILY